MNDSNDWVLPNDNIIKQGAEARIYEINNKLNEKVIVKERFKKNYRHPNLDKQITMSRMKNEVRNMLRARTAGIDTPCLQLVDLYNNRIYMEYIEGMTTRDRFFELAKSEDKASLLELSSKIGDLVKKLHDVNVIHGDLTTSNILLRNNNQTLVLIDFGLSSVSKLVEDKAVDLYVLERALLSTHRLSEDMFQEILKSYAKDKYSKKVIKKLDEVRARGRKKDMIG